MEAVKVLKEISQACPLTAYQIMLMPPNADDVLSKGNQIHIKANLYPDDLICIRQVIEKYGLKVVQEKDLVVIYRPIE